ncbi:MAG: two component transcriptional regulator, winged helix family [Myxococcaceae bacterium]|nr:two component transcriptional regulator, winged helix family [Myxococcaceae bacterium]
MVKAGDLQVLLIEDEAQMRRLLRSSLPAHGYVVVEAPTGRDALVQAGTRNPDIILLDLGLPDMDGVDLAKQLRELTKAPIIVLSARGQERDKVDALDAGADDYVTKPFGLSELLARMRVARRHLEGRSDEKALPVFTVQNLRVDLGSRQVLLDDHEVHLTPIEYKLLTALVKNAGRVVTHQQLLKEAWGPRYATQTQYLHVYMGHLRAKLETESARPKLLLTEPGVGYRLAAD